MNRALAGLGFAGHDLSEYKRMVGHGNLKLAERALPEGARGGETVLKAYRAFKEDYAIHQLDATAPYPGIPELLGRLKAMGWPLAVLSNKDHENTLAVTEHYFPGVFDVVLGALPGVRPPKPDPTGALEILSIFKKAPGEVCYFGDSPADMETALRTGCFPAGVSWGFRTRESVMEAGAGVMLDSPEEFFEFLRGRDA